MDLPLLHTSTQHPYTSLHVTSFTRPSPVLVLQVTNAGARIPGYEAVPASVSSHPTSNTGYADVESPPVYCRTSALL